MVQKTIHESLDLSNNRTPAKIPDSVYLMKHITRPAILVECGFLSNPEEEAKLREAAAEALKKLSDPTCSLCGLCVAEQR